MSHATTSTLSEAVLDFCRAVVGSDEYQDARHHFTTFQGNQPAFAKYEALNAIVNRLNAERARIGQRAAPEDEAAMDQAAQTLFTDPASRDLKIARGFVQQLSGKIEQALLEMIESGAPPAHIHHEASCSCGHHH